MTPTVIAILCALPVLLALAALFSAAETALFSLEYGDRLRLQRQHPKAAKAAAWLLDRPSDTLVTLLFFNMMTTTIYFVATSILLLEAAHMGNRLLGFAVSAVNLLLMTVVSEVVSKMLAARRRVEFARFLAPGMLALTRGIAPVRRVVVEGVLDPLVRVFLPKRPGGSAADAEELAAMLTLGAAEGAIDPGEQALLRQVMDLNALRVRDVMTPRTSMKWLSGDADVAAVGALVKETRLTRVPVVKGRGGIDDAVAGFLDVKSFLSAVASGGGDRGGVAMGAHIHPARFVPERATLDRLLEQFRAWGAKVALAVDEHGAVVGIVTIRDVVRQITAALTGEGGGEPGSVSVPGLGGGGATGPESAALVEQVGPGRWRVAGRFPARDLRALVGLPADRRVSTVAGLVMRLLGRVPREGDRVRVGLAEFVVERVTSRVADRVMVRIVSARDGRGGEGGAS